jgi:hypothetical protein
MKNLFTAAMVTAALFCLTQSNASPVARDTTFKQKVSTTTKKVVHKTSNAAANGAAVVVDKKYEGKCGPHGETVYINKNSHYYYVNSKGHRVYLQKSELMDKKM